MLADAPILWQSDIPVRAYLEAFLASNPTLTHAQVYTPNWRLVW
jgi:hypothetical protein